jgi:predicted 3-demethylubiquinone-9 3-methyltransferase (glyoxalase superfamily)
MMQKINACLWFNDQAEEAVAFYLSIFKNSKIIDILYYPSKEISPHKKAMTITFELEGQTFIALNGGPYFTFNHAISFYIHCYSQEEVDELWAKLSVDGQTEYCGWLKDKYGVSWQIVPIQLIEKLSHSDPTEAYKTMKAMLKMNKIELNKL